MMGTLVWSAVVGDYAVDADAAEGFRVGDERQLPEGRCLVDIEVDGAGEITAVMLPRKRDVVADPPTQRPRGSAQPFQRSEFAGGKIQAEAVLGRRQGG